MFVQWHDVYVESKEAEFKVELARSLVKGQFALHGATYFVTSVGTVALQNRAPQIETDWEAIARAHIAPKKLAALIPLHTTRTPTKPVLAAPREWSAEAGVGN